MRTKLKDLSIDAKGPNNTPSSLLSIIVTRYSIANLHPKDRQITALPYKRKIEKRKATINVNDDDDVAVLQSEYKTNYQYLNIRRFDQYPWSIFEERGVGNEKVGLLKCGIFVLAKRKDCEQWRGRKLQNSVWLCGSNQWHKMNIEKVWLDHESSPMHIRSLEFLRDLSTSNIGTDVQARGKAYLTKCQEKTGTCL